MKLACVAKVSVDTAGADAVRFTVKYTAVAGPGFENATRTKPLYSGAKVVSARTRADGATVATSETVAVSLYRLRPGHTYTACLLYTSPSPRDGLLSRMPSSA